jgi:MFS family permease
MLAVGAANGGFQALNGAVIVRETETRYIGRVLSLTLMAFAGFGLMALPLGALADAVGERGTLAAMGVCVLILSVVLGAALARERPSASSASSE